MIAVASENTHSFRNTQTPIRVVEGCPKQHHHSHRLTQNVRIEQRYRSLPIARLPIAMAIKKMIFAILIYNLSPFVALCGFFGPMASAYL
jgi:hypothetical protein